MTVVEFPTAKVAAPPAAKRAAESQPRNSRNSTSEERAAKTALRKGKSRTWYRNFGHRLRVARLALGITEAEAAAASLITLRAYRNREAGLPYRGWYDGLGSFVDKYDLSLNWMFSGNGEMRASAAKAAAAEFAAAYNALTPNQQETLRAKFDKIIQTRSPARPALVLVSDDKKPA